MRSEKEFFVGVDSDGCVFNSMEIKQKKCLLSCIIENWKLEPIREFVIETGEFVSLYSKWRGLNRFAALAKIFDLLKQRIEIQKIKTELPRTESLTEWLKKETKPSNSTLKIAIEKTGVPFLKQVLQWSEKVDKSVVEISKEISLFDFVKESLEKLYEKADIAVVSTTPKETLHSEWKAHGIIRYAKVICGLELGCKKEQIALASGGKYKKENILMLGDAFCDLEAAKENGVLFYPIIPGKENKSWEKFYNEASDKFFNGEYAGKYETELVEEFKQTLPSTPPWGKI